MCILVGGIDSGGNIVVGPEKGTSTPPIPMLFELQGVHEILGVGTIFPNEDGKPSLHMHAGLGREGVARVGCIRPGVDVWKLGEAIILEIAESSAQRLLDPTTGFHMLEP
jgi:predicted DNA-binding protein with PD1-like motif